MTLTLNEIKILQSLPLDIKIKKTKLRIQEFYRYFGGDVCVAFSGGKDSTVLLHLVRSIYPDVPAVFNDTGLEYPEVREFVKTIDNVVTLKPEMGFKKVIETYGYPVVSKNVAMQLRFLQNRCPKNEKTCVAYLTGIKQDGTPFKGHKLAPKWHYLIDAPFKISEQCCNIMKKNPSYKYYKENGLHPYVGTMAENSEQRKMVFMRIGCNNFTGNMQSKPLSPWMEKDIWNYINQEKLPYSKIYDVSITYGDGTSYFDMALSGYGINWYRASEGSDIPYWGY